MRKSVTLFMAAAFCSAMLCSAGCGTHVSRPSGSPQPSKVRFSEFTAVEMKHLEIADEYASSGANQKAARKIDEELFDKMRLVFPGLRDAQGRSDGRTLLIEPYVKQIKFIGGAARFWVGAWAGSSAVLMKVTYTDTSTGEVLVETEFYRAANAMGGAYSMGATDNQMLEAVAQDIANYSLANR